MPFLLRKMSRRLLAALGVAVLSLSAWAQADATTRPAGPSRAKIGDVVANFALSDLGGQIVRRLGDLENPKAVCLIFFATGCPINKMYAPRYRAIAKRYADRGVVFWGVNSNEQDSREDIAKFCLDFGLEFPVLLDHDHRLADQLGTQRTTEIYVLDGEKRLRYHGRLDDQYSLSDQAAGVAKDTTEKNHLTDALDAVLAGKPVAVETTEAPGCLLGRKKRPAPENQDLSITYHRDIVPIMQRRCQVCHRPGEIGPFDLMSYDDVSGWASMIREVVEKERMPPWNANPKIGTFSNDRRLSAEERDILFRWIDHGTPEGDPKMAPPPLTFADGWRIGKPDAIFEMPVEFKLPAEGTIDLQYFAVPVPYLEDRFVKAIEIRPGNRQVVHHVVMMNVKMDDMESVEKNKALLSGQTGFWAIMAPGEEPTIYPDGMAKRLLGKSMLVFSMHYTAIGKPTSDRTRVGIVFAKEPPKREVQSVTVACVENLLIPAKAPNTEVRMPHQFDTEVMITDVSPHMHMRGKSARYVALHAARVKVSQKPVFDELPPFVKMRASFDDVTSELVFAGSLGATEVATLKALFTSDADKKAIEVLREKSRTEVLVDIPRYDFRWQHIYRFTEPKILAKGSLLLAVNWFDNSPTNPLLTESLWTKDVYWGQQTWDEMAANFVNYVAIPKK